MKYQRFSGLQRRALHMSGSVTQKNHENLAQLIHVQRVAAFLGKRKRGKKTSGSLR
jgi:hypothetical protein